MHADEIETSLMLELAPEAVQMARAHYPSFPNFARQQMHWTEFSDYAVLGDPRCATAEKGRRLFSRHWKPRSTPSSLSCAGIPMIARHAIQLDHPANTPEQAILAAGNALLASDACTESYVQAMVDNFHQFGPYFVIAPVWQCPMPGLNRAR